MHTNQAPEEPEANSNQEITYTKIPMILPDMKELIGIVLTHMEAAMPAGQQLESAKSLLKKDLWAFWNCRFERIGDNPYENAGLMAGRDDVY